MDVLDLLHPQDILARAPARAKRPLLRLLADRLAARCGLPEDSVLAALLSRENLGSTGIGHGIAVPHALMKDLPEPAAALAVLDSPVCYRAPDEQPVDVALAVIWPRERAGAFTLALARCCRRLARAGAMKEIRNAASASEVVECIRGFDEAGCSPHPCVPPSSRPSAGAETGERWT